MQLLSPQSTAPCIKLRILFNIADSQPTPPQLDIRLFWRPLQAGHNWTVDVSTSALLDTLLHTQLDDLEARFLEVTRQGEPLVWEIDKDSIRHCYRHDTRRRGVREVTRSGEAAAAA